MLQFLLTMYAGQKAKMDERGASAVEYGLMIAGIAALIAGVVFAFSDTISDLFTDTETAITDTSGGTGTVVNEG